MLSNNRNWSARFDGSRLYSRTQRGTAAASRCQGRRRHCGPFLKLHSGARARHISCSPLVFVFDAGCQANWIKVDSLPQNISKRERKTYSSHDGYRTFYFSERLTPSLPSKSFPKVLPSTIPYIYGIFSNILWICIHTSRCYFITTFSCRDSSLVVHRQTDTSFRAQRLSLAVTSDGLLTRQRKYSRRKVLLIKI